MLQIIGVNDTPTTEKVLAAANKVGAMMSPTMVLVWFLTMSPLRTSPIWWLWMVGLSGLSITRYVSAKAVVTASEDGPKSKQTTLILKAIIGLTGLHLAILTGFMPLETLTQLLMLCALVILLIMGNAYTQAASFVAFLAFCAPMVVTLILRAGISLPENFGDHINLPLLQIVFLLLTIYAAFLSFQFGSEIRLGLELLSDLRDANAQIESQAREMSDLAEHNEIAATRAEAANLAKSRILANTSHEIRTPMNAVLGMAQALKWESDPAKRDEHIDLLLNAGQDLKALLNDIVDLSHIESGKSVLNLAPGKPVEIISDTLKLHSHLAQEKQLSFDITVQEGVPEWIMLDRMRLRQCFGNLVSNAIKFTDVGGVSLHLRSEPKQDGEHELTLDVIDTGIGLAQDEIEGMFSAFARSNDEKARMRPGAGLGLTITQNLAREMGGDLTAESTPDKGSRFSFRWIAEATDADSQSQIPFRHNARMELTNRTEALQTILVAEDHKPNQIVLETMLNALGLEAEFVSNGKRLAEIANEKPFAIMLVDMHMPEMTGLEAVKAIRDGSGANQHTPIIVLSADASAATQTACLESGANSYIVKPIDAGELVVLLNHYLAPTAS